MSEFRYIAKPVEVEAFEWKGPFVQNNVPEWFKRSVERGAISIRQRGSIPRLRIAVRGGPAVIANPGWWVVKSGEHVETLRPDTFHKLYGPKHSYIPQYDMPMG